MSDELNELDLLKQQADVLGVKYGAQISVDTLRERVAAAKEGKTVAQAKSESAATVAVNNRQTAYDNAMKLVRIRLSCMDPAKSEWPGELITIANDVVGDVKKYIPYNEAFYENGYHVPNIIYQFLKDRKYGAIKTVKGPKGDVNQTILAPCYNIEVLPQLTETELEELKLQQAASKTVG